MNKNRLSFFLAALTMTFAICAMAFIAFSRPNNASAAAPSGSHSFYATTSVATVGPSNNVFLVGTTTRESAFECAARVITTGAQPIMLSFFSQSSTTLSAVNGIYQAASTTVVYDGELTGCGYVTARSFNASTSVIVLETH